KKPYIERYSASTYGQQGTGKESIRKEKKMTDSTSRFYNALAGDYHLIFDDWTAAIERHAKMIDTLIRGKTKVSPGSPKLLDCSCGIGTQTIGLARLGYNVTASDLSRKVVRRAK